MAGISDPVRFIRDNTVARPVPHAAEIRLQLADEAMELWQKTEDELGALGLPPPFWAFAWAGGQALARYLLDHPERVAGRSVLDFAAGSGIVGIAAKVAGARRVVAADIDAFAIAAIGVNADLNGVEIETVLGDLTGAAPPDADLLVCGDVFYELPMSRKVLAWLDRALEQGIEVLVGDPGRSYLPKDRLAHLATYTVPVVGALEDSETKKTSVYRLVVAHGAGA
ncbi:Methyltransferase protein [Polymorphum gilvum SL003B-26A1]|uniref:Methyltransferase protein n=1 Tax=Polymorphum gilvum (strain LMG 25793 / CGMCC 1.9160 / SL003B-26A1) TaxID=991905 RepID=F2J245_POLGS|nr:Methyltransferase protein [Polymorphum gilvum SL003B-26A1]